MADDNGISIVQCGLVGFGEHVMLLGVLRVSVVPAGRGDYVGASGAAVDFVGAGCVVATDDVGGLGAQAMGSRLAVEVFFVGGGLDSVDVADAVLALNGGSVWELGMADAGTEFVEDSNESPEQALPAQGAGMPFSGHKYLLRQQG